ncbi:hypothetical protein C4K38_3602 [Pseudomonas chlororaphis subsp. piscium]|nr:hypothetical protein C4K38_3602 [Pseudomonas chlororaphis subsp. piscium]
MQYKPSQVVQRCYLGIKTAQNSYPLATVRKINNQFVSLN